MNRKAEYDSYEIEEPSDEERAGSRWVWEGLMQLSSKLMCTDSVDNRQ